MYISPHKITPYVNNPRENETAVDKVVESIKEYGFRGSILVDENYEILAGHTRWKAALALEMKEVPVTISKGLTDDQKRGFRIADNKTGEFADWDWEKLAVEMDDIGDLFTGFDEDDFPEILENHQGNTDPDSIPGNVETRCKIGDLWQLGEHRLVCGDSTISDHVDLLLDGVKPILMVTDPPYGVEYNPKWRKDAAENGHISYAARSIGKVQNDGIVDWSGAYSLFPGDVAYVWHAGRHASEVQLSIEKCEFSIICQIIWGKNMFAISRGDYHWQHEPCWYAVRNGKRHNWQGSRSESTLWEIGRSKMDTGHGTQKPIECMERPIRNNSAKGEGIYDPFLGSGTTMIAAEKTGRICYGMEIDPHYCDVILQRFKDFTGSGKKIELVKRNL